MQITIYEAKTQLSWLVEAAHRGQIIIIAKAGTPMAKLVPLSEGPRSAWGQVSHFSLGLAGLVKS